MCLLCIRSFRLPSLGQSSRPLQRSVFAVDGLHLLPRKCLQLSILQLSLHYNMFFFMSGMVCLCGRTTEISPVTGICLRCVQDSEYEASLLADQQVFRRFFSTRSLSLNCFVNICMLQLHLFFLFLFFTYILIVLGTYGS
jgi:hypothetical protein